MTVLAVALGLVAALLAMRVTRGRGRVAAACALVAGALAGWLLGQTVEPDLRTYLAVVLGLAAGGVLARRPPWAARGESRHRGATAIVVITVAAALLLGGWIGSNSPTETWLGPIVSHGPRARNEVALTFDDGPNVHETLVVAHILDSFGVKGTFFTVGKALVARPDISRALMRDGQLLGDHSYHHDQWRWLDPRYPELERTQSVFRKELGVCPTFYRPPHGEHTPFMSWVLARKHMTMVGWDTSAADWATKNAHTVARRILERVRPGSIVVLHDGLDGDLTADRTVLTAALPIILRGLQAKHLRVVRLDRLLGIPGYGASHC
jgi:peptidoglycan/xylan/chitin deacetylase (PgdA/CDA1 family)